LLADSSADTHASSAALSRSLSPVQLVATVDLDDSTGLRYNINLTSGTKTAVMTLHRLDADPAGVCRAPKTVNSPIIDAGPIYSANPDFLQATLRLPNSCKLRTTAGNLLPVTTKPNGAKKHKFVSGDTRVSEHALLTSLHIVWMREHNRICDALAAKAADGASSSFGTLTPDQQFEKARKVCLDVDIDDTVVKAGRYHRA
jgi:hypothetical protein